MKRKYLLLLLLTTLLTGCQSINGKKQESEKPTLTVTIEPLRYFTEAIAGNRFRVISMVPKGSSPETYDPTPQQFMELSKSRAYLRIGYIGFEQTWMDKLTDNAPHLPFYDMSEGVELIRDEEHKHEAHPHSHEAATPGNYRENEEHNHTSEVEEHHHHHHGGVEPHIWNSPSNAQIIAENILKVLCALDKEGTKEFTARHDSLQNAILRTDSLACALLSTPDSDRAFMIYHPALSYFARDYGLLQISIEEGGKEPSPAQLKKLIDRCREEEVHVIFVQPEFDRRNAEIIAKQTGTRVVPINPLAYEWHEEMLNTARALSNNP
ncbi:MAG: zinc ABC transporter substrate-binding protein [Bacteroides sp.]|nr:zinc ABC transporter substrate-binding protein [Bacteroides sp.]